LFVALVLEALRSVFLVDAPFGATGSVKTRSNAVDDDPYTTVRRSKHKEGSQRAHNQTLIGFHKKVEVAGDNVLAHEGRLKFPPA